MKTKIITGIGMAALVALLLIFIAWMSGYNFDHRSPEVGEATFYCLLVSICAGVWAAFHIKL